jgi:radical SAM superfamily enzyme YgiQ (UPF0313 family)
MTSPVPHPKGTRARVLLTSVFGPYAVDDAYGSRAVNPMELYENQVTRVQGAYSLRMFHRSFSLLLLQENIDAPCTVLDFPSEDRFARELETNDYDVVGISGILPNLGKVARMCERIRSLRPGAAVVVGGHVVNHEGIETAVDADHIVRGDGIRWLRRYLGQDPDAPVRHPAACSAFGSRIMGIPMKDGPGETAAILIPSVGCPVGCNFCSTSAMFGGKGRFVDFFESGDALFEVMCRLEKELKAWSFFVLDENFLLHRKRALRLLERMERHGKSWMLNVFSSARVLKSYTMDQLLGLGIGWVWMGIEGASSRYRKLRDVDTRNLVQELQSQGIRVLGSSIIGLEEHRPETMDAVIAHAVAHATDFHQFMLYTPNPGTPLWEEHKAAGTLKSDRELPPADAHGQYRFRHRHPHIPDGAEEGHLLQAFREDFAVNGPSLARLTRTLLTGWLRHRHHPDPRIRRRWEKEAAPLPVGYAGAVWAMARDYRNDPVMHGKLTRLLSDLVTAFGWRTRLAAPLVGRYVYRCLLREKRRLAAGWRYEPECFCEKNAAARALERNPSKANDRIRTKGRIRMSKPMEEAH